MVARIIRQVVTCAGNVALLALAAIVCAAGAPAAAGNERLPAAAEQSPLDLPAGEEGELLASEPFLVDRAAPSRLSVRLGSVILQRARPHSDVFMYNPNTGATVLNTQNLVYPFQGGVDAGLLWHGSLADLEVRYFGVEDWHTTYGPVIAGAGSVLNIPGVDPNPDPLAVKLGAHSSLQSVEFNVRRNVTPRFTWLAGFRYLSFRDAMKLYAGDPPLANFGLATFGATNQLFGMQIGADAILWQPGPRFRIESAIKAGVYANGAASSLTVVSTDPGDEGLRVRLHRDRTAFVGDLNFLGVYQLNRRWAIRAGYQLLWLSGVATGPLQFHSMNFNTGYLATNVSGTAFFHGALVGLERSW